MVHPAEAGPLVTNKLTVITIELAKKNQYESMLMNPLAISRAPICNGISKFENVPDNPAVRTKNTMIVP